jgi:MFS family permease
MTPRPALFTRSFFLMWSFSFTVFLSVFMLLPTVPFRILALGGSNAAAGLFLGLLTYSSALTAPITGAIADRMGKRRMLIVSSLAIAAFSIAYGLTTSYVVPLVLVVAHGVFWSGLLSASAAHMTDIIPEARRTEGIAYWGLASIAAIAVAPILGFRVYERGWGWVCAASAGLNLLMAALAWRLREPQVRAFTGSVNVLSWELLEWRVLLASVTLFLFSFGYGGITSFVAVYAEGHGVRPKEIFFTTFALVTAATRPISGPLADRFGHKKLLYPCLALVFVGLLLLTRPPTRAGLVLAAAVFAAGMGNVYPAYVSYVMKHVDPARRGAAFGGVLAAFDTGVGTGSIVTGWISGHAGFRVAFAVAAALSALAGPYFYLTERRLLARAASPRRPAPDPP